MRGLVDLDQSQFDKEEELWGRHGERAVFKTQVVGGFWGRGGSQGCVGVCRPEHEPGPLIAPPEDKPQAIQ